MDHEQRIRDRAYALWEAEGRPDGRHLDHWDEARRTVEAENGATPPELGPDYVSRGPDTGLAVPDNASERHLREAAARLKAVAGEDAPHPRPSADPQELREPGWAGSGG